MRALEVVVIVVVENHAGEQEDAPDKKGAQPRVT